MPASDADPVELVLAGLGLALLDVAGVVTVARAPQKKATCDLRSAKFI
jgi:hypothetical protein